MAVIISYRLTSWNLPYVAYVKASGKCHDQASPFGTAGTTPPYLNIPSPGAASSAHQTSDPSPTTKLVHHKRALDRSSLLLQGRHRELLTISSREDRITLTDYFHDFYMYSFVTAKYWGKGPRRWTPAVISALTLGSSDRRLEALQAPSQLCRWLIYVPPINYKHIPDIPDSNPDAERDDLDPNSLNFWQEWPSDPGSSYTEVIHESITHGSFSRIPSDTLPLSTQLITESVRQHSKAVELDAWKMAIMSGNVELLVTLWEKEEALPEKIADIHPIHLAATFLDGANTGCCMIAELISMLPWMYLRNYPLDDLDHTLLDKFMINILRSHTSVYPEEVSNAFNPPHRFPGEEKNNCGRWDADSPVIRALFCSGYSRIPNDWKHAFCHTAIQAICHSSIAIYGSPLSPDINALSGLFVRRCGHCGLQLKLGPLHALVVVTFYLAHRGMSGETLFGPLAILVCLMSIGADPLLKTNMSVEDILGTAEPDRCHHRPLDALDLMEAVPVSLQQT
ncbi:hypothetical protein QC764_0060640 [Podospora pseudoanserina]|uniref:Uncharacterized protein n=1 Tax=Podospora pseudoanserina TaxID=2609844 RepID=A0ABR0I9B7_9PEZI|nr:hypothetical protein QC764_0060640 [Podospora pseudoanserina]